MDKNIQSWHKSDNSSYNNFDCLVDGRNIRNLLSDKTFLVRDSKRKSYSIYFAIENNILEIDNDDSFLNEPESLFSISKNSSYLKKGSKNNNSNDHYISDIKSNWNNNINSCIENYLRSQICIDSYIFGKVSNSGESKSTSIITSTNDPSASYLESSNDFDFEGEGEGEGMEKFKHLWISCEDCYGLNYKKYFKSKMNICEHCGSHLKMSSSDRIELLIDPDTWNPMDEYMVSVDPIEFDKVVSVDPVDPFEFDMVSVDPIEFDKVSVDPIEFDKVSVDPIEFDKVSLDPVDPVDPIEFDKVSLDPVDPFEFDMEEEPYINRLDSYQKSTGLMEAVQTGTGQLNGIPLAIGIMEFQFMGGSMGSVVGEKITRLIEYATNERLPLILVCASGGARMQEGSLSLMQMAKISSALYDYQINQKLFYVPILTSPTTGGVTASFGMLGDIIIAEPNAYIAFAGKRVIEQTLKKEVPEGSQSAEFLFEKGLFDSIVPRNLLKEVLTELFKFHGFVPLTQNEK